MRQDAYGIIYVITNTINGKQYVGQTIADPQWYWKKHLVNARSGNRKYLYSAIRKYGDRNFRFDVVFVAFDKMTLDLAEDCLILEMRTLAPLGYNMMGGGHPGNGNFSEVMRQNLSAAIRASCADPQVRQHKSEAMRLVWERREHREKIAETNAKPEVIARKSAAVRASHDSPEFREAARQRGLSQFSTPEAIEAQRQRSLEQFADPVKRERNRIARNLAGSSGTKGWRWITNGVETSMMPGSDPLPEGWRYGDGTRRLANKRWITDGTRNNRIDADTPMPEGFRFGKTVKRRSSSQASVQAQ